MNNNDDGSTEDQLASFQKIWLETVTKMMQVAFTVTPNSPPPEAFRHIRGGVLRTLAESWEQFLRSPQFLEAMKQSMEQAVTLRKMSNEFLGKVRHEMQAPSRDDIDTVMLAVRHMEKRLLDRMEQLSSQISEAKEYRGTAQPRAGKARPTGKTASPQAAGQTEGQRKS
jgi:hypothetical protein